MPDRKTLLLTGASRGIGHATVKRFASAGWRVITCSRQPFPEDCPWEMGEEDHIQLDLADPQSTMDAVAFIHVHVVYMYMNFALSQLSCLGAVTCNLHAVARGTNQEYIQRERCGFKPNPEHFSCIHD